MYAYFCDGRNRVQYDNRFGSLEQCKGYWILNEDVVGEEFEITIFDKFIRVSRIVPLNYQAALNEEEYSTIGASHGCYEVKVISLVAKREIEYQCNLTGEEVTEIVQGYRSETFTDLMEQVTVPEEKKRRIGFQSRNEDN